jgi:hypothetical protein
VLRRKHVPKERSCRWTENEENWGRHVRAGANSTEGGRERWGDGEMEGGAWVNVGREGGDYP